MFAEDQGGKVDEVLTKKAAENCHFAQWVYWVFLDNDLFTLNDFAVQLMEDASRCRRRRTTKDTNKQTTSVTGGCWSRWLAETNKVK